MNCLGKANCESHYKISSWLKQNYLRFIVASTILLLLLCYAVVINLRPIRSYQRFMSRIQGDEAPESPAIGSSPPAPCDGRSNPEEQQLFDINQLTKNTRLLSHSQKYALPDLIELIFMLGISLLITIVVLVAFTHSEALETALEPFSTGDGVGTWTPLFVRFAALLLTLVLLLRINVAMRENALAINQQFFPDVRGEPLHPDPETGRWKTFSDRQRKNKQLFELWTDHLASIENLLTLRHHIWAAAIIGIILVFIGEFVFSISEDFHYRGSIVIADKIVGYLTLTLLAVMVYIVTRINSNLRQFMDDVCRHQGLLSTKVIDGARLRLGLDPTQAGYLLPIRICSERSIICTPLLIQPFAILLIVLFSYNDYFKIDGREPYAYLFSMLVGGLLFYGGISIAARHNIEFKLYISPSHATLMQAMWKSGVWPASERWKQLMLQVVDEVNLEYNTDFAIIDFEAIDAISTETTPRRGSANHHATLLGSSTLHPSPGRSHPGASLPGW